MIGFTKYTQIKDKCCIGYFGHHDPYLTQLRDVRPLLEESFPGLQIYLSCRDGKQHLIGDQKFLPQGQFHHVQHEFGCLIELRSNGRNNPVDDLLKEAGLAVHVSTEQQS